MLTARQRYDRGSATGPLWTSQVSGPLRRAVLAPERTLDGNPAGSIPRTVLAADRKVARYSALRKCDGGNESPRHLRSLGSGIDSTAATTAGSLRLANDTSGTKVNGRGKFRCHIVTPSLPKSSSFLYRFRTVFCSTKSRSRSVRNQNGISARTCKARVPRANVRRPRV